MAKAKQWNISQFAILQISLNNNNHSKDWNPKYDENLGTSLL